MATAPIQQHSNGQGTASMNRAAPAKHEVNHASNTATTVASTTPHEAEVEPQHNHNNASPVTSPTSPVTSPPYWVLSHSRSFSNVSVESVPKGAITLQDNTDEQDAKNKACWARGVYIEDFVVVNGNRTGIGAFVVWNITVETLRVSCQGYVLWGKLCIADQDRVAPCE